MKTNNNYIVIGIFTILSVLLVVLIILFFSNNDAREKYDIIFSNNVSGLVVGSPVTFNGVSIGEVSGINLDKNNSSLVIVRIFVKPNLPIKVDTTAQLALVGITGLAGILLSGGSSDANILDSNILDVPIIQAKKSEYLNVLDDGTRLLEAINLIFSEDNVKKISNIIESFEELSENIKDIDLKKINDEAVLTLASFKESSAILVNDLSKLSKSLDNYINGDLDNISNEIVEFLAQTNKLIEGFEYSANESGAVVDDFRVLINEANEFLEVSSQLIEKINDKPSILLFDKKYPEVKYDE